MRDVEIMVEYSGDNFSAYIKDAPVMTVGKDLKEIEENMWEAVELYLESCKEMSIAPAEVLQGEFTLKFRIDGATFINYYRTSSLKY